MLSIALALIVSQNPWQWANDPKYYSGPVIDYCRNGSKCTLSSLIVNTSTTPGAQISPVQIISSASTKAMQCFQNTTNALSLSRNAQFFDFAVSSTCASAFYAYPLQIDTTSLRVITGASHVLQMDGYATASLFPAASTTTLASEYTTDKIYQSDTSQWLPLGSAKHPVLEKSTIVYGWKALNPGYEGEPLYDESFTGVTQTEFCAAGTLANVITMPVGFGTEQGYGRSFTTQAAALASCGDYSSTAFTDASNSRPILTLRLKSDAANITSTRMLVGFGPSSIFTGPTDTPASEGAWFRYSTSAGDTNLMGCTSNGAAATCTSTGVAYAANTTYLLRVDLSENGAATFWVNGLARLRRTTNLPSTTNFGQGVVVYAIAASARNVITSRRVIEMSR